MQQKGITVFSGFDGMSCGQIALTELGIPVEKYYASEIDRFSIQQTQLNFPDTIQLGDIENWREWDIDWSTIDLIIGGSPCQGFSFAGKQLNFSDPRSKLFFVWVDLLNHIKKANPQVKFLLENVNMKKEFLRIISEYLKVFPVRLNSNRVSAQNRDRWYWSNIKTKETGLFSELWTDIPEPADRGILLKDILQPEEEVDEKYYLKNLEVLRGIKTDGKASSLTVGGHGAGNHSDMDVLCVAMRGHNPDDPNDRRTGSPTEQRLEAKTDGKTNCLTSVGKDNLILQRAHGFNKGGVFEDKSPSMTSSSWENNNHLLENMKLRRLTPIECARLQTVPDWYKWEVSDSQIYKLLGNGWTIEIIAHILSFLK